MNLTKKITRSNFFIKLRSWEFWPFGIVQFPAIIYWLWLSLRARSLVFFSAANPGITMGGMFGESKFEVLKKIPAEYTPKTIFIKTPVDSEAVQAAIAQAGLTYPLIFKPDIGERGFMVQRINAPDEINEYVRNMRVDLLIQECVLLPLEFGVFYTRFPGEDKGKVTSVVAKEMLSVTGDGKSTLKELIFDSDRAKLQWEKLKVRHQQHLDKVVAPGQKVELVSIGNHAVGTTFLDANHLINNRLHHTFDLISKNIEGFYFGRFDLRCSSLDDLYSGRIKILELNGCGAEPAHIYDPDFPFLKAVYVLLMHWNIIYKIAEANKRQGAAYMTLKEAMNYYRRFKAVIK